MKRLAIIVSALALMVVASCSREPVVPETVEVQGIEMTFTAFAEVPGSESAGQTRTQVVNSNLVYWSPSDVVGIFYGTGKNGGSRFVSQNTEVQAKVDFTGVLGQYNTSSGGKYFWAVYPFRTQNECDGVSVTLSVPGEQTATKDSFDPYSFPSVARSSTNSLQFYNVCGGLMIETSDPDIESVTISGNNGEILAGTVKVGFGADKRPYVREVIDGLTSVTIKPVNYSLETGCKYYVSLLPATFSKGFSITFSKGGNSCTRVYPKARTLGRSVFGAMSGFDTELEGSPFPVELGLSVKWATYNVGATSPEYHGDYFAWGETEKKDTYTWGNYLYSGTSAPITKYNVSSSNGKIDYKTVLDESDDPATRAFGEPWRLPTMEEVEELMSKCTWTWTKHGNVLGYEVSGRGNTIFLPAAGSWSGSISTGDNETGGYWSSSLSIQDCRNACALSFNSAGFSDKQYYPRFNGLPVRAVHSEFVPVEGLSFEDKPVIIVAGESCASPVLTISPANATDRNVLWLSSDESVAKVAADGTVSGIAAGSTTIVAYASNGLSAEFPVTVKSANIKPVDMGLSVKWAPYNLGASTPEASGGYYAWGETEAKSNYDWSTYLYCDGASSSLSKYNYDASLGAVDFKTLLDPSDDPATRALGYPWRMPTRAEMEELINSTPYEAIRKSGVFGFEFTAPNGNSIFLPDAGYIDIEQLTDADNRAGYWTSGSDGSDAYAFWSYRTLNKKCTLVARALGLAVRPVYSPHVPVTGIEFESNTMETTGLNEPCNPLAYTIIPDNATDKSVRWVSEDESIVKVDPETGVLTTVAPGTAVIKIYASSGVSASYTCIVHKSLTNLGQRFTSEAADMGLSVKWAARNLGADKPSAYGKYYAWGETSAVVDLLGGNWRLPTKAEVEELMSDCFWTFTELDGVPGFRISALKSGFVGGNIFIPLAGYKADSIQERGDAGYFWTSSLLDDQHAVCLGFDADGAVHSAAMECIYGLTVRPVLDE